MTPSGKDLPGRLTHRRGARVSSVNSGREKVNRSAEEVPVDLSPRFYFTLPLNFDRDWDGQNPIKTGPCRLAAQSFGAAPRSARTPRCRRRRTTSCSATSSTSASSSTSTASTRDPLFPSSSGPARSRHTTRSWLARPSRAKRPRQGGVRGCLRTTPPGCSRRSRSSGPPRLILGIGCRSRRGHHPCVARRRSGRAPASSPGWCLGAGASPPTGVTLLLARSRGAHSQLRRAR